MNTVFRICVGATIAIFAALLIAAMVFHIHIERGLTVVGFFFVVGLPMYIGFRIGEKRDKGEMMARISEQFDRCKEDLEEIEEHLDDSIEKFRVWGWHMKDLDKTDERAYYGDVALEREEGMYTGGLSAEYGKDVSRLIEIRRKLDSVRYAL
jgi:hypothetical protein